MDGTRREDDSERDGAPGSPAPAGQADDPWGGRKSRSQKKREAHALGDVGLQLVGQSPQALLAFGLDDELRDAVLACRGLTKNARSRQLRLIAKLLRTRDVEPMVARLQGVGDAHRAQTAAEQENEHWRAQLLAEGDPALTRFIQAHPGADAGALRDLIRQARRGPESARGVRARRELLRLVRRLRATGNS